MNKKVCTPQIHAISCLYDKESNEVCFYPNGLWMFRYSYPSCTLWEDDIEILNVKRINVIKAIYMVRCLSRVKDTIHMTYKQLCEAYNTLNSTIKHSILNYFVPYTDGDEDVPIVDCYGDIDSYGCYDDETNS